MSELQKNIINKIIKEKKKSKGELAKILKITVNSLNRTLKNDNITYLKLEKIADYLEININELLPATNSLQEAQTGYFLTNYDEANSRLMITNLSEALNRNSRTIEMMAETEKANVKNIENLVKIIAGKF